MRPRPDSASPVAANDQRLAATRTVLWSVLLLNLDQLHLPHQAYALAQAVMALPEVVVDQADVAPLPLPDHRTGDKR